MVAGKAWRAIPGLVEEQCCGDLAAFGSKDVVGSTGRLQVHHFQADTGRSKGPEQGTRRKAQALAGAEQNDFRAQCQQLLHVSFAQGLRRCGRPFMNDRFRQQNQVFAMFLMVDCYVILTVGGEHVESGNIGLV